MAVNRGKEFEQRIKEAFEKVPNVSIDRVHDQTTRYKGSTNICDFVVYKEPYEYYIECKSVHGNVLPFKNITDAQWSGLLAKSRIKGVYAGIICWWVDRDVTKFIPIDALEWNREFGYKSLRYDHTGTSFINIEGKKRRVYFDYEMSEFFRRHEEVQTSINQ